MIIFPHIVTSSPFLYADPYLKYHHSHARKTSFNIGFSLGLPVMNSFTFLIYIYICLHFWNRASIINWHFPFSTLKILLHCLLVYIDFNKISAIILIFIPLHVIYFFPLAAFKVFSLSLILNNFIIICLGKDFFMFFEVGINWTSWICEFIKFEKIFTTISLYFLFFLISPLGMLIKYISGCLNCSQFTNTFFF